MLTDSGKIFHITKGDVISLRVMRKYDKICAVQISAAFETLYYVDF